MAPVPQDSVIEDKTSERNGIEKPLKGEEVVISGISGIFPKSDSVLEFMENLYNEVDMVSDDDPRWIFNHPEVPKHMGKVNGMCKFDSQFFRVHYKQACTMEPMSRKLLEHAYGAIFDSGINPLQLRGKKVGVFIGSTSSESEKIVIYENIQRNGFGITGCNKAMYANRISYWIDGKGPSYALDLACASSMACLEHAYRAISEGQCDAAIVGGCNLCMHPNFSLNLKRAGFLCLDGKTKCFDKNGDGYVRSDAISVLFLQKAKCAKRIYSQVYHAQANYSLKEGAEFLPIRDSKDIQEFLEEFYSGIDVSPNEVEFVEASGSGIAQADGNELEAIGRVFGKEKPINVGSVKSNMGHSESASGACSITKVCLAYHKGQLPANLHYYEPQDDFPSVRDQRVKILQEKIPFNRGFTALNSFSYSGANIHVLLKGHYKPKDTEKYKCSIPHLVLVSGRQESCVSSIIETLKKQPVNPEQIGLLHSIHEKEIPGHMCRGFTILETDENNKTVCLSEKKDHFSGNARPIWFVYSGMGSQWAGMGSDLMKIPTFASAIQRCHNALEPKGINIVEILTKPDKKIYDNILNSFVGIAAVQIGLTDILNELGIVPDNIIGHSVGELGCAYADGCFTAEEMILAAYSRGLVSIQTPFIRGSMAAVGLGYKTVLPLCPPGIEVACHNSSESSTISGPADIMKTFVEELTSRGVFAKEVPCSNIAYHSQYIAAAGPGLLKYLNKVITNPKERSPKWVSTSVPQEQWIEPRAKYSSAEYHTNNLLNSVLFEETAKLIPSDAIVIEIAPHGLLQAILKRSHTDCIHVPLTRRGHSNPVQFLLEAVGKLYQEGLNPKVENLYPKIEFPVSTETPLLSHLVEWEHSENWPQAKYNSKARITANSREFVVSIHDEDYKYLEGYVRDGINVFPEAAILVLVWETLAMNQGVDYRSASVIFNNIHFHGEANVKPDVPLRLSIMVNKGNHEFEVSHDGITIASGTVAIIKSNDADLRPLENTEPQRDEEKLLSADDVYKILSHKGFSYENEFKTIQSCNLDCSNAYLRWNNDWTMLLDAMIQYNTLARVHRGISVPKFIKKITINMDTHSRANVYAESNVNCLQAYICKLFGITRCAGVEIDNITFEDKPITEKEPVVLMNGLFVPHFITGELSMENAILINLQVIADNLQKNLITVTEIATLLTNDITNHIKDLCNKIISAEFEINSLKEDAISTEITKYSKTDLFVVADLLKDEKKMKVLNDSLTKNNFILTFETNVAKVNPKNKYFNVITSMTVQKKTLILLNKVNAMDKKENVTYTSIPVSEYNPFSWVSKVQLELKKARRVVLVSERQSWCGVLGLVKEMSKDYPGKVGVVVIDDYLAPSFNPEHKDFKRQLDKNLSINIFKKGKWGGYYYMQGPKSFNALDFKLSYSVPGDIDSLIWTEASVSPDNNTKIQVCFVGPSVRDGLKAVGLVNSKDEGFGIDFSGIDSKGKRVMGIVDGGSIASTVQVDPDLLWPVPEYWSLDDAATVPLPYVQAYYCLTLSYGLHNKDNIFINSGAGALGQAVISICLSLNCNVFTTVSNVQEKRFLLRLFPQLKAVNITCSHNDTFSSVVCNNTKRARCGYVLSTLSGSLRLAAMKCVGFSGLFLDVIESDNMEDKELGMSYLREARHYKIVRMSSFLTNMDIKEKKRLQVMLAEGIAQGVVKPLSRIVFSPNEVTEAFRILSSSNSYGRVLIKIRDPSDLNQGLTVKPHEIYTPQETFIIIGDGNGLGIELADRLVNKGAKKLLFNLKQSTVGGYFWSKVESWKKQNVVVTISTHNLQTKEGCNGLLKEGLKLGSINGIFIVQDSVKANFDQESFAMKFNKTDVVVANLDLVSRNVCAELKNFVVIAVPPQSVVDAHSISVIEGICEIRSEIGLPALVLHANALKDFDRNSEVANTKFAPQTLSTFFSTLEISMKLKYNNVKTFDLKKSLKEEYFEKIANIFDVKSINELPQDISLEDLTISDLKLSEIGTVLKEAYQANYSKEQIKLMSINHIKCLCEMELQKTNFDSGLGAFYTFIDEDECMATEPLVTMPTKVSNATEAEDEQNPKDTYMMLIPGFEGHHQIFRPICERLKLPAITYQLGPDVLDYNIPQMAEYIMQFMKKRFELTSKFYLLGYSFGVNVALELANLLEKEGHLGIVYCVDSSPDVLRNHLDTYVGKISDTDLENRIVEHMYRLMTGKQSVELRKELRNLESWKDKVEACVNKLRGVVHYSHQYKRSILESAYRRIKLTREYNPNLKLKSDIVLLKGLAHPKAEQLPHDYNLSKYTENPIKIYNLESDHATAPNDCRISNVINSLLEPNILEEFKKKNLCDTYVADSFKML